MSTDHSCPKGCSDHSRMRQQVWNSRYGGHTVANFLAWDFGGENLERCQTRSRDAEGCRVHRTLSNTHSHMAACVRASKDFRRDFSTTGSAFGIGVVSPHLLSISCFMCESVETAQSLGDETHAVATLSTWAREHYALSWSFASFGGQLCPSTCVRTRTRADGNGRRLPLKTKMRMAHIIMNFFLFHCICCI